MRLLVSLLLATALCMHARATDFALPAGMEPGSVPVNTPQAPSTNPDLTSDAKRLLAARATFPAEAYEIDALAATFKGDAKAAFAWVRDTIRLDAYSGHLRDAFSVLGGRAGNDLDRAVLLKRLLDEMKVPARFASADATPDVQQALVGAVYAARAAAPDAKVALLPAFLDRVRQRAVHDYNLLADALGTDRLSKMDQAAAPDLAAAFKRHVWVQAQIDGAWVDLDPGLPDAQVGTALLPASANSDKLDDADNQTVTLAVHAKTTEGDVELLTQTLPAAQLSGREVILVFQPATQGYAGAISGDTSVKPTLLVAGEGVDGKPVASGMASSGGLGGAIDTLGGDATEGLPSPVSEVSLHITTNAPGEAPVETVHVLAAAPAGGALPSDDKGPLVWRQVNDIVVSNGGQSPRDYLSGRLVALGATLEAVKKTDAFADQSLAQMLWPTTATDLALPLTSERVFVEALNGTGVRAFVSRPRVTIVTTGPAPGGGDRRLGAIDLAIDGLTVTAQDARGLARERLWYGALEAALETEYGLVRLGIMEDAGRTAESASTAIDAGPLSVFDSASNTLKTGVQAMLDQSATATIVLAGDPASAKMWWTVEPNGLARAVTDPNYGSFIGGGNYVNSSSGGVRYIVDEATGAEIGQIRDGITKMRSRPPPQECSGGNEYMTIVGCVSIPAGWALSTAYAVVISEAVIFAIIAIAQL